MFMLNNSRGRGGEEGEGLGLSHAVLDVGDEEI
jgi:hypothetical protein